MQQDFGYTATWAGLVLSPGGLVTMVMMFVVGRLSAKVQPKYLIVAGAVIVALSMYDLTNVYGDRRLLVLRAVAHAARRRAAADLPADHRPHPMTAFRPDKTDQASALINAARNTGGSIGVSLVSNVLAHREQFHQSRLVEHVVPSSIQYQDTLQRVTNYFAAHGSSLAAGTAAGHRLDRTAGAAPGSLLAYMDVFWVLMLISLAAVPLALVLRKVKLGVPRPLLTEADDPEKSNDGRLVRTLLHPVVMRGSARRA